MGYFVRGFPMLRKLMRMFSDVPGASRRTARVETVRAMRDVEGICSEVGIRSFVELAGFSKKQFCKYHGLCIL